MNNINNNITGFTFLNHFYLYYEISKYTYILYLYYCRL